MEAHLVVAGVVVAVDVVVDVEVCDFIRSFSRNSFICTYVDMVWLVM